MQSVTFIEQTLARGGAIRRRCAIALAALLLAGCARVPGSSPWCLGTAAQCASQALRSHAIHRLESWDRALLARPVPQRVAAAPPQLLEYLTLDNVANGYAATPRAAVVDEGFAREVRSALERLPAPVLAGVDARLLGIYLVEGLGSTGFTDIADRDSAPHHAFIVLDAGVLAGLKANAWATWKENTPFAADPTRRLQARIEADPQDTRENAIQYILLHELAHVLAVDGNIHPDWARSPREVKPQERYPFFDLSWRIDRAADRYTTRWDAAFAQRAKVAYYVGARLTGADLLPTYENLARTDFPTLYAATHPADDFAESLASYVHVVLLARPWSVTITGADGVAHTFGSCWDEARCQRKRALLEAILARPAPTPAR
jgi:hypothetical protein